MLVAVSASSKWDEYPQCNLPSWFQSQLMHGHIHVVDDRYLVWIRPFDLHDEKSAVSNTSSSGGVPLVAIVDYRTITNKSNEWRYHITKI
jgi:hypothetical protein